MRDEAGNCQHHSLPRHAATLRRREDAVSAGLEGGSLVTKSCVRKDWIEGIGTIFTKAHCLIESYVEADMITPNVWKGTFKKYMFLKRTLEKHLRHPKLPHADCQTFHTAHMEPEGPTCI